MPQPSFIFSPSAPLLTRRRHLSNSHPRRPPTLSAANKPPTPPDAANLPVRRAERSIVPGRENIPTLFNGPEAVLGIVIAAAALLADFAKNLTRLATSSLPPATASHRDLFDVDRSISALQTSLDLNQATIADTERLLDEYLNRAKTAEQALAGIGTTRDSIQIALDQAVAADSELSRIQSLLAEEKDRRVANALQADSMSQTEQQLNDAIAARQNDVKNLRRLVDSVRAKANTALEAQKLKEEELNGAISSTDDELQQLRIERENLMQQTKEMELRAASMSEQVSAATLALDETRSALQAAEADLDEKRAANAALDEQSAAVVQRSMEADGLRVKMQQMERELGELQAELHARDAVVNQVARESDHLRSLLAARDAELGEVMGRLESAIMAEESSGGDPRKSEASLEEIKSNLDAEQMALMAEISKAELASFDISEEDLDPLDRLEKEMGAEEKLLEANLRKAESTVRVQQKSLQRRIDAIEDVMKDAGIDDNTMAFQEAIQVGENDAGVDRVLESEVDEFANNDGLENDAVEVSVVTDEEERIDGNIGSGSESGDVEVGVVDKAEEGEGMELKQSLGEKAKRRGRPPKKRSDGDSGSTTPKRKRGRPRKKPEA